MARTVAQALKDEIHYPLPDGFIANRCLDRDLDGNAEVTAETKKGNAFKGAVADCLWSLLQAPNISEAGVSISLPDRDSIIRLMNSYYNEIGEPEKMAGEATVKFGW